MKSINGNLLGIDKGEVELFTDYSDNGPMWYGEGDREHRVRVDFNGQFSDPPVVHVSASTVDISNDANTRYSISVTNIESTGFTIVVSSWRDTKIARMTADWIAFGEVNFESEWDV